MGNEQCKQCKNTIVENQAYGAHQIVQENNQTYVIIEKKVQKNNALRSKIITQLEMRQTISHPNIVKLHKYNIKNQNYGLKIDMLYEYVPRSLRDRIEQVTTRGQIFTEREIFSIIYAVESGLQQLYKYKIKHCCINLDTILLKNNIYKITDMSSLTYMTSYDLVSRGNREQFLSERLLQKLSLASLYPYYSVDDDYFSLGIIALLIGTGRPPGQFYQWSGKGVGSLNLRNIDHSLKKMQQRYSSKLVKKIKQLLYEKDCQSIDNLDKTINENLNSKLQQLDEQFGNAMIKATSLNSTALSQQKSLSRLNL